MPTATPCLVAFDIDNCLMPMNEPPEPRTRELFQELNRSPAHLVLASGKPCLYLSGLARGLGTPDVSLVGENGGDIWLRGFMPPGRLPTDVNADEVQALVSIRQTIEENFGDDVFFQPNRVGVTAFAVPDELTPGDIAAKVAQDFPATIVMYEHEDSVEWAIDRFNKGNAIVRLARHLEIPMDRTAAVGDASNDVPMLEVVRVAYWVGDSSDAPGDYVILRDDINRVIKELIAFARSESSPNG